MKLFTSLRRKLIPGTGVKKYLLYALGEIILVVLGILIALGINQASEKKSNLGEMRRVAKLVHTQMIEDQKEIETVLKEWDIMQSVADTILNQTPINKPIDTSCQNCFQLLLGSSLANTSIRVPNLIRRNPLVESKLEKQLHHIELIYNDELQMEKMYNQNIYDQLTENINYWKNNFDWFAEFLALGNCNDSCLDYFQNSFDYRNRVAYFEFTIIGAYYYELEKFKNSIEKERKVLEDLL